MLDGDEHAVEYRLSSPVAASVRAVENLEEKTVTERRRSRGARRQFEPNENQRALPWLEPHRATAGRVHASDRLEHMLKHRVPIRCKRSGSSAVENIELPESERPEPEIRNVKLVREYRRTIRIEGRRRFGRDDLDTGRPRRNGLRGERCAASGEDNRK
jgi:hypothetical protein